jgi:hypothetical protein
VKPTNAVRDQNAEVLNIKGGSTRSYHCALKFKRNETDPRELPEQFPF